MTFFFATMAGPVLDRYNRASGNPNRTLALKWMSETPLIDGHNDLPYFLKTNHDNQLEEIDLTQDLSQTGKYLVTHTDIPRAREGRLGAQFWSAYTSCNAQYKDAVMHILDQIDVIKRMCAKYPEDFQFVTTAHGIEEAFAAGRIASMIGVEGGHNIDSFPSVLRMLRKLGALYMTLTHSCNTPWADNWRTDSDEEPEFGGLTDWGKRIIVEMNRIGIFVDLSHVSVDTMRDALEVTQSPVIFSHSSAFGICDSYRNVNDEIMQLVKENGGVIMVNFYNRYIKCDTPNITGGIEVTDLKHVADHIEYIANVCGYDCVGIGSDYDGVAIVPRGLEDVSKYPDLITEMIKRGWNEEQVKQLLGNNLLRAMRTMEQVSKNMKADGIKPLEDNMPRDSGGEKSNHCRKYYYN